MDSLGSVIIFDFFEIQIGAGLLHGYKMVYFSGFDCIFWLLKYHDFKYNRISFFSSATNTCKGFE